MAAATPGYFNTSIRWADHVVDAVFPRPNDILSSSLVATIRLVARAVFIGIALLFSPIYFVIGVCCSADHEPPRHRIHVQQPPLPIAPFPPPVGARQVESSRGLAPRPGAAPPRPVHSGRGASASSSAPRGAPPFGRGEMAPPPTGRMPPSIGRRAGRF